VSFYSPIDRLAQTLPRPKGTGLEFMTELSKMPGYKAQEAEDRGLQALTNLPKMERAQFMEALKAKPPVVPKVISNDGTDDPRYLTREERLYGGNENQAFHEQYTLPGGTNYREILLKHPLPQKAFSGVQQHFGGEGNILASVRAKDRRGPNGEKILHIEELQSDWHQQGREKGYTPPDVQKQINNAERAHRKLQQQLREAKQNAAFVESGLSDPTTKRMRDLNPEMIQRLEASKIKHNNTIMELLPQVMKAEAEHQDLLHQSKNTVPDAPFKKNWHEMALKKMIHHAAANGYDAIAITPGAEQADRYGLAKHVSDIRYDPYYKQLIATGQRGEAINKIAEPHELPSYVGKDVAEKLLKTPISQGMHKLSGLDLESGGEGMKGFYDKMIPSFLNQFGKKYGAKVGQGQINVDNPNGHSQTEMLRASGIPEQNWRSIPYSGIQQMMAEYSAKQPPKMAPVHMFPITSEMREDVVKNGVPLYADGGSVEGEEPKKTVKAYKLFRVHPKHPGKLFPLFVDANTPVEMDKWIDAKEGEMAKGKVKSKIGPLAYRPGWHAGDLPIATHIGEKSDPSLTAPDVRPENHAWAEVEMPDDVDWQAEATKRGTNAQGRVIPVKAHITDQIPKGGHYRYKTNPNMTGNWLIGGSMKVNRVLTDKEVAKINKAAGLADLPRAQPFKAKKFGFAGGGTVAPDEWKAEEHVNHMADGGPVPPLRPLNPQLAAMREQLAQQAALHKAYNEAMTYVNTNQMPTFKDWVASQGKAKGGKVQPLSERFDLGPSAPFDPIGNAEKSLRGAYDMVSKIPGNLKRLVTDPVAYAKSLPAPDAGQLYGAFMPGNIGFGSVANVPMSIAMRTILPAAEREANLAKMLEGSAIKKQLYHGTAKDVKEFDNSKLKRIGYGDGFHLAESPNLANYYARQKGEGANVMPVHAVIKNPFIEREGGPYYWKIPGKTDKEKTDWLKSQGYDGIKYDHGNSIENDSPYAWVAFEPTQIKSAIGNKGTYDLTNPDITKAKGGAVKPVGYTKEQVTVSPNLDAMRYELMSVKRYTKKVK